MTVRFTCPHCGKHLTAPASHAGQERKCPNCRTRIPIPSSDAASQPASSGPSESDPPSDHPLLLFANRGDDHANLIDMTAMVDIVFFLLIFFLVTSMQSLEAVINLPAPQSSAGASSSLQTAQDFESDPDFIVVTIDADDSVWVEDEEALSEPDLRAKLRAAKREADRDSMLIKGAGDSTNGKFVMVLDAAADVGMKELLFSVDADDTQDEG